MSDWYGSARSNHFCVKDKDAFLKWVDTVPDLIAQGCEGEDGQIGEGVFMIYSDDQYGGWPAYRTVDDADDDQEIDLLAELSKHLAKGEVAVLMEIGAEKIRYLSGIAQAVDWRGRTARVSLTDIYEVAAKTFRVAKKKISEAAY